MQATQTIRRPEVFRLYEMVTETLPDGSPVRGIDLRLHAGQEKAWEATERIVAVIAGTQGGKTVFGPWWLHREIAQNGPGDYLAVTATFDLFKLKMLPSILEVFVDVLGIARYWAGDQVLELCEHVWDEDLEIYAPIPGKFRASRSTDPMWARIILRSAAAKGGLEAASAKAAWLDEAGQDEFGLTAWEAILRRLSLSRGRILITTTPYNLGWLKQQVYDAWRAGDPDIQVIQFSSIMNPAFPRDEFAKRKSKMDGWKFRMFYEGQFERPAGLIYTAFIDRYDREGGHKVKPFTLPQRWPRWVGVDPGGANVAKVWLALDPDTGRYFLYRESLDGDKSTAEHAREVRRVAEDGGENLVMLYVGNAGEEQVRRDWQEAGVYNVSGPPFSEVESGIDTVIDLLKTYRLFFFETCTGILDEIGTYRRVLDENGEPTDKIKDKERYHRLDALRYGASGVERGAELKQDAAPGILAGYRG